MIGETQPQLDKFFRALDYTDSYGWKPSSWLIPYNIQITDQLPPQETVFGFDSSIQVNSAGVDEHGRTWLINFDDFEDYIDLMRQDADPVPNPPTGIQIYNLGVFQRLAAKVGVYAAQQHVLEFSESQFATVSRFLPNSISSNIFPQIESQRIIPNISKQLGKMIPFNFLVGTHDAESNQMIISPRGNLIRIDYEMGGVYPKEHVARGRFHGVVHQDVGVHRNLLGGYFSFYGLDEVNVDDKALLSQIKKIASITPNELWDICQTIPESVGFDNPEYQNWSYRDVLFDMLIWKVQNIKNVFV